MLSKRGTHSHLEKFLQNMAEYFGNFRQKSIDMKFYFRTLGCKMNWLDSARISAGLQNAGHVVVESEDEAEYVFVNSCIVTAKAEKESRREAAHAEKLGKKTIIFGCGPKANPEKWQEKFPDQLVFGKEQELLDHFGLSEHDLAFPDASRTRLPVAIQAGCDNFCTFCITRIARGRHESLPAEGIIRQIRRAEAIGIKEVVFTGINLAAWGCSNSNKPEQARLGELLLQVLQETTIPRIRLSSLGPQFLNEDFYEAFSNPRVCDHLHLSIQSGSPSVVERMNRGHGVEEVYAIAEKAPQIRPDVAFTADFIAGFPGETADYFLETVDMVERIGFAKLHVFPFSARQGTGAANFPEQVPMKERKDRARFLRKKSDELRQRFIASQLGKQKEVLVESDGTGLTRNYIRVALPHEKEGSIHEVVLSETNVIAEK